MPSLPMRGSMELSVLAELHSDHGNTAEEWNEAAVRSVMYELLDEITLGLCFDVHRACKIGSYMLGDTDMFSEKEYEIVNEKGVDVFGQVPTKKQYDCVCPNCQRNLAASRFAPHLEKCMGMGRNSSRIASRRIQVTSGKKESDNDSEDNHDDNDWSYLADRRAKRLKKEKLANSPRRTSRFSRLRNGDVSSVGSTMSSSNSCPQIFAYESMPLDDKRALLTTTCGVISEHTKKMCTRSHRCPQHSNIQRKAVREHLLGKNKESIDDIHVDIDSYEDGDSQSLRDSMQWEVASNPSPADSTSTTSSASRRRRAPTKAGRRAKSDRSTPTNLYDFV